MSVIGKKIRNFIPKFFLIVSNGQRRALQLFFNNILNVFFFAKYIPISNIYLYLIYTYI